MKWVAISYKVKFRLKKHCTEKSAKETLAPITDTIQILETYNSLLLRSIRSRLLNRMIQRLRLLPSMILPLLTKYLLPGCFQFSPFLTVLGPYHSLNVSLNLYFIKCTFSVLCLGRHTPTSPHPHLKNLDFFLL